MKLPITDEIVFGKVPPPLHLSSPTFTHDNLSCDTPPKINYHYTTSRVGQPHDIYANFFPHFEEITAVNDFTSHVNIPRESTFSNNANSPNQVSIINDDYCYYAIGNARNYNEKTDFYNLHSRICTYNTLPKLFVR